MKETTSQALKTTVVEVLGEHGLHIANLRGQRYDGASNMRGEFNGLQKLIRGENPYAFYVHCFAHQLRLVVIFISRCCSSIEDFFEYVTLIVNNTTSSCKRKDVLLDIILQEKRCIVNNTTLLGKLGSGEISSGRGKKQATSLTRPRDTRCGLIIRHYFVLNQCGIQ